MEQLSPFEQGVLMALVSLSPAVRAHPEILRSPPPKEMRIPPKANSFVG